VAVDAAGALYLADSGNHRVVKVVPQLDGTGDASGVSLVMPDTLVDPAGVALDGQGGLYITDYFNHRLYKTFIDPKAGSYTASEVSLALAQGLLGPRCLGFDAQGDLYSADEGNSRVVRLRFGAVSFGAVALPGATNLTLRFTIPPGLTAASVKVLTQGAENLDFTLAAGSTVVGASGTNGVVNAPFQPTCPGLRTGAVVLYGAAGNVLASVPLHGTGNGAMAAFSGPAQLLAATGGQVVSRSQAAIAGAGRMYLPGGASDPKVHQVPAGGGTATPLDFSAPGTPLSWPVAAAVDGMGNLYVTDRTHKRNRIVKRKPDGNVDEVVLTGNATLGALAMDRSTENPVNR
jgi:serine/threonine-protein kinase